MPTSQQALQVLAPALETNNIMTNVRMVWGPAAVGVVNAPSTALSFLALSNSTRAVGWVFCVPVDGIITDVGYLTQSKAGTPPAYNFGVTTVNSTGRPTTTAYGGSAITSYTPSASSGWTWVTLGTPATAVAGEWAAVHIYPTGSTPDGLNYVAIHYASVANVGGTNLYNDGGWLAETAYGTPPLAVRYDDGTVYGLALANGTPCVQIRADTTPDEVGNVFTVPVGMVAFGAKIHANTSGWGAAATLDVLLYDSVDNVIASASISDKDLADDGTVVNVFWDAVTLAANQTYRLACKATTATNGDVYLPVYTFESDAAKAVLPCGDSWHYTTRTDDGAWTDDTSALCPFGLWVSAIEFTSSYAQSGD